MKKISLKQHLKSPERPPDATIFPFQLRHVGHSQLKVSEIPPTAMRLVYDRPHSESQAP